MSPEQEREEKWNKIIGLIANIIGFCFGWFMVYAMYDDLDHGNLNPIACIIFACIGVLIAIICAATFVNIADDLLKKNKDQH